MGWEPTSNQVTGCPIIHGFFAKKGLGDWPLLFQGTIVYVYGLSIHDDPEHVWFSTGIPLFIQVGKYKL